MGHATIEMTVRCSHLSPDLRKDAVSLLGRAPVGPQDRKWTATTRQELWRRGCVAGGTWLLSFVALALGWLLRSPAAEAHARGIVADSCGGCHSGTGSADVNVTLDRATVNPGDDVTLTLTIKSATIRVGGVYITTGGVGTLQALSGEGLGIVPQGLIDTAPKSASNGVVTFRLGWQAPDTPGAVAIQIAALAANGDGTPSGDDPGSGVFQWTYGCTGRTVWRSVLAGWPACGDRARAGRSPPRRTCLTLKNASGVHCFGMCSTVQSCAPWRRRGVGPSLGRAAPRACPRRS